MSAFRSAVVLAGAVAFAGACTLVNPLGDYGPGRSDEAAARDAAPPKDASDSAAAADPGVILSYTSADQLVVVPPTATRMLVKAWGAGGGNSINGLGGAGGYARGTIPVVGGETMFLVIGGAAGSNTTANRPLPPAYAGSVSGPGSEANNRWGAGSGGYAAVKRGNTLLLMAGGGGGAGMGGNGGAGGGGEGSPGTAGLCGGGGLGGTASDGGAGGTGNGIDGKAGGPLKGGEAGGNAGSEHQGGAGGGGLFGGGGGGRGCAGVAPSAGGGGGGSGFIGDGVLDGKLEPGSGTLPGNAGDPDRGSAAEPNQPGQIVLRWL